MRALQALVIIMGILLVAGGVTVAVTIIHRISTGTHHVSGRAPARVDVNLPAGTHVESVGAFGDRLALKVTGPAGDSILLVDPATGAVVETLDLNNTAPVPQP